MQLTAIIWAHVVLNCILDGTCGHIGDLLGPLLTQFNTQKQAIPATQRPKSRSYVLQGLVLRFYCTHDAPIMQLALKIWAHVVHNCILDDTCGYIGDLVGSFLAKNSVAKRGIPTT